MKLAMYRRHGKTCFGGVLPGGLVTLTGRLGQEIDSLRALLALGAHARTAKIIARAAPDIPLAEAELIPENAILCGEAVTTGRSFFRRTREARPHDYLALNVGPIGLGLALTAGAAIACPDRKVIRLQADGSGLYTVQSLWTHAREHLNILTLVFAKAAYNVLRQQLKNVGAADPRRQCAAHAEPR